MMNLFHLIFPAAASTFGTPFDNFSIFLLVLCGGTTFAIFCTIFVFIVKYHHTTGAAEQFPLRKPQVLEYAWTVIPLGIFFFLFWWGTRVYLQIESVPAQGLPIFVMGKQWMWELEHTGGQKEINELHVPVGRAVRLTMISQDVIHSFYIPAFRIKQDVLPGRYTYLWFTATETGRFRILCSELCGTNHSEMTGWVTVMEPTDYEHWLEQNASVAGSIPDHVDDGSLVELGREIFEKKQCVSCHSKEGRAPSLIGVYGHEQFFEDGTSAKADDNYLLESIVRPSAKIVRGYPDIMPSFQGQLTDREVRGLVEYIKTLSGDQL